MFTKRFRLFAPLLVLMIAALACNLPSNQEPTPIDPNLVYTAAAQTVQAQLTQGAVATQVVVQPTSTTAPGQPSATPIPPTATAIPTNTPLPTSTSVPPTATPIPIPCDRGSFVSDVSIPDNTEFAPGTQFVKTWRLKNNGSCTWTSSYALVFDSGDAMSGPASVQLTTGTVPPGSTVDISVSLKAPDNPGTYQGFWKLRNAAGVVFGIGDAANKNFWVKIKVVTPTPTPTATPNVIVGLDFISRGPDAQWRNASEQLPWGDPPEDGKGVAVDVTNYKLEDNKTYPRVLVTFPQWITDGMISGLYPSYTVVNGDHFKAQLGLRTSCGNGKVRYQLRYVEGLVETTIGDWIKSCDGTLLTIDINLANLAGRTVQFKLVVMTEGSQDDDRATWVSPRIER